jgi:hypothetical protein
MTPVFAGENEMNKDLGGNPRLPNRRDRDARIRIEISALICVICGSIALEQSVV